MQINVQQYYTGAKSNNCTAILYEVVFGLNLVVNFIQLRK